MKTRKRQEHRNRQRLWPYQRPRTENGEKETEVSKLTVIRHLNNRLQTALRYNNHCISPKVCMEGSGMGNGGKIFRELVIFVKRQPHSKWLDW